MTGKGHTIWMFGMILLAASAMAQAQRPPSQGAGGLEQRFKQFDRNGDGKITQDEAPANGMLKQYDANADGIVTMDEVRARYVGRGKAGAAGRAASRPATKPRAESKPASSASRAAPALEVVNAVFDLCARDVAGETQFYRDGIGMREVEPPDAAKGVLLEWAGTYLRIRPATIDNNTPPIAPATGNPIKQMTASNGYRWFSLWFNDPKAIGERLVKAGYPQPTQGGNVSMTRDPEGNLVEIMGVPRSATGETFTVGMAASDEAASRRFYGQTLGLAEFDPWNLPPPFSMKMYLFQTGAGRIKFSAPPGDRPRDADLGPNAPGLRSVTLRVKDLASAREALAQRGAKVEEVNAAGGDGRRLLLADPDGNRLYMETATVSSSVAAAQPPPARAAAKSSSASKAGRSGRTSLLQRAGKLLGAVGAKPAPHKEELAEPQRPGEPPLKKMLDGDPARDATGRGQLFESVIVPGVTGIQEGMNGVALADINRDGLVDIVAAYSAPRGQGGKTGGDRLRVLINQGQFRFQEHPIQILDSKLTVENFGASAQVPNLADFNGDGFLDILITRNAAMMGGAKRPGATLLGNTLLVSQGRWDTFREVSAQMGIRNEEAYNRQPSIGDVNKDGWLDVAIGCDNIKNAYGGYPYSRLYVFQPKGARFEDGTFQDIGGTDLVPDFGGFYHDSNKDKAGPDINLRDLDNDGDLDLVQSYHVDCAAPDLPYCPGEYRQGVFCWRNMLTETGQFRFERVTDNGLACVGRLKYNKTKQLYEPVSVGPGLPYITMADVDNDGLLDVLAVGPDSPYWAPRAEDVSGRFWHNLGGFKFQEATAKSGLDAINWNYGGWLKFFDCPISNLGRTRVLGQPSVAQPGFIMSGNPADTRPYYADAVFGDFNNDGWRDLVVLDRHELSILQTRAMLFMNRGDGTFEPQPTTFSGLDSSGIAAETADLNNDGLLDLIIAADPDNSGVARNMERYESKVYWNTGEHGARENHWLRVRFSGVKDSELIGARVEARDPNNGALLGLRVIFSNDSYKSGCPLEAHFGLGRHDRVNLRVTLLSGRVVDYPDAKADQLLDLNLSAESAGAVVSPTS